MTVKIFSILIIFSLLSACQTSSTTLTRSSNAGSSSSVSGDFSREKAAKIRLGAGLQYLQAGSLKNAKRHLDKALEFGADSGAVHFALAYYFEQVKEYKKAKKSYKKSLKIEPKNPDFLNGYASYLCGQKDFVKADEYYKKAINVPVYPEIASAYLNAGVCAMRSEQFEVASEYFRKALNRNSQLSQALLEMAKLQYMSKDYERSATYLERFESLVSNPRSDALWLGLKIAYFQKDKDAKASYANKLEQLFPDSNETAEYLDNKTTWM
ncbi:MAG: type IV pilus assembly protein PilF [Polaribacter sp.]|jgi:type IV pilus assembly protein PilF